ncbi:MAG: HEAT repeat domain-containing protein [Candidatus Heimdallarchaeota archaeon]
MEEEENTIMEYNELTKMILEYDPKKVYFIEIIEYSKWDEIKKSILEVLSFDPNKIFHHLEDILKDIIYYGCKEFLEIANLLFTSYPDKNYIPVFDEVISSLNRETGFYESDAIGVMKLMCKIDSDELIPYLADYATRFFYVDYNHFMGDASENFRYEATKYLSELKSSLTLGALKSVLNEEGISERILIEAIKGLGESGNKGAIPLIYRMSLGYWFYNARSESEHSPFGPSFKFNKDLKNEAKKALKKLGIRKVNKDESAYQFLKHYGAYSQDYEFLMEIIIEIIDGHTEFAIQEVLKEKQEEPLLYNLVPYIWYASNDPEVVFNLCKNIVDYQVTYVETKEIAIETMPIIDERKLTDYLLVLSKRNPSLIPQIVIKFVYDLNAFDEANLLMPKAIGTKDVNKINSILEIARKPDISLEKKLTNLIKRSISAGNFDEKKKFINVILELVENESQQIKENDNLFQEVKPFLIENLKSIRTDFRERSVKALFKFNKKANDIGEILKEKYIEEDNHQVNKVYIQLFMKELDCKINSLLQNKIRRKNIASCKEELLFLYKENQQNYKEILINLLKATTNSETLRDIFDEILKINTENILPDLIEIAKNEKGNISLVRVIIRSVFQKHRLFVVIPSLKEIVVATKNKEIKRSASQALFDLCLEEEWDNISRLSNIELISVVEGMHKIVDYDSDNKLISTIPHLNKIIQTSNSNDERIRAMYCIYLINQNVKNLKNDNQKQFKDYMEETKKLLLNILKTDKETTVRIKAAYTLRLYHKLKSVPYKKKELFIPDFIKTLLNIMKTETDEIATSCIQTLELLCSKLIVTEFRNENILFDMMSKVIDLQNHIKNELFLFYNEIKNTDFKNSKSTLLDIWFVKKRIEECQ